MLHTASFAGGVAHAPCWLLYCVAWALSTTLSTTCTEGALLESSLESSLTKQGDIHR